MKADFHHATLASLAYSNTSASVTKKINKLGYPDLKFLDVDGAQVYIMWNKQHLTIAFRGTEPKELSDIKADLKTWKTRSQVAGRVHDGFYDEIKKLWEPMLKVIKSKGKGKSISICGHSLGAAMATIAAARLTTAGHDIVLYTFGSPRVGNFKFINSLCVFYVLNILRRIFSLKFAVLFYYMAILVFCQLQNSCPNFWCLSC